MSTYRENGNRIVCFRTESHSCSCKFSLFLFIFCERMLEKTILNEFFKRFFSQKWRFLRMSSIFQFTVYYSQQPNWKAIIETCNLWRNFDDIQDSWDSVTRIIDYYGDNQDEMVPNAGPGHWNDPDMVGRPRFKMKF